MLGHPIFPGPGEYCVSSFFEALHVLTVRTMPFDRPLGEYIAITILLGKLIRNFFEDLKAQHPDFPDAFISKSIGVLSCFIQVGDLWFSEAVIGFSVSGYADRKSQIKRRKSNLPELLTVAKHGEEWDPGNCVESQNFAHLSRIHQSIRNRQPEFIGAANLRVGYSEIISVSLTLSLVDGNRKPYCKQCKELAGKLSTRVFDLCPKNTYPKNTNSKNQTKYLVI